MKKVKKLKTGYILAFLLGALGIHAFYYQKYTRGAIYAGISILFSPLIPLMMILGWVDMLFIKRWQSELQNGLIPSGDLERKKVNTETKNLNREKVLKKDLNNIIQKKGLSKNQIVLQKYAYLKTRSYILDDLERVLNASAGLHQSDNIEFKITTSSSGETFIRTSNKYKSSTQTTAREIPLQAYWTTFDSLNEKQLKWYLHWREQVLNQNYINVDMSYIILFVYELINYSFNKEIAFNTSMMENLYENYKERHPKLNNYLPKWTADMLYEADELELASQWDPEKENKPKLYSILEEELPLGTVSMTTWREFFINHNETPYFSENRSKVYKVFKTGMKFLDEVYKGNNTNLLRKWFENKDSRVIRELYSSAVMGRDVEAIHIPITMIKPKTVLTKEITAMIKLSENISRKMNGVNRKVQVNEEVLAADIKERMEKHFFKKEVPIRTKINEEDNITSNERFKIVKEHGLKSEQESLIPDSQGEENNITNDIKPELTFDKNIINNKTNEMNSLVDMFAEEIRDEADEKIYNKPIESQTKTNESQREKIRSMDFNQVDPVNIMKYEEDEDIPSFEAILTNVEMSFILLFSESEERKITAESAQQYTKEHGVMLSVFLSDLNGKSIEFLGDVLFESISNDIEFNEELESVLTLLKERSIHENKKT